MDAMVVIVRVIVLIVIVIVSKGRGHESSAIGSTLINNVDDNDDHVDDE